MTYVNEYQMAQSVYLLHGDSRTWLEAIAKAQVYLVDNVLLSFVVKLNTRGTVAFDFSSIFRNFGRPFVFIVAIFCHSKAKTTTSAPPFTKTPFSGRSGVWASA